MNTADAAVARAYADLDTCANAAHLLFQRGRTDLLNILDPTGGLAEPKAEWGQLDFLYAGLVVRRYVLDLDTPQMEAALDAYLDGASLEEAATTHNVSKNRLRTACQSQGDNVRGRGNNQWTTPQPAERPSLDTVISLYRQGELSLAQAAKMAGVRRQNFKMAVEQRFGTEAIRPAHRPAKAA